MTHPEMIQCRNLSFSYDEKTVLEKISLSIHEGEFIGLIGPNGGGKTTFLNLLMGFLKPQSGSMTIFDKTPVKMRRLIGYVPQHLSFDKLFPITLEEVVLMGLLNETPLFKSYSPSAYKRSSAVLEQLDLLPLKNRLFGTLSGGQIQRTLIARALVSNPSLLLLDEPTASVDFESQKKIYELLSLLKKKVTILMVTHQVQPILKHVDRILCVQKHLSPLDPDEICKHYALGVYHAE
ncbi:MAG: ABC transporter ATP-binding protein [Simkaniaceae bacterium]